MTRVSFRLSMTVALVTLAPACGGAFERDQGAGGSSGSGGGSGSGSGGTSASGGSGGSSGSSGSSGKGGSLGTAGAGGASGSAGSGGGGSCNPGGPCSPEGSTCSSGECCPCLYECRGGIWEMTACAACPAPSCPFDPPADGQTCDVCSDQTSAPCFYDQCPVSKLEATCNGTTWSVAAHSCGSGCGCATDADCSNGQICVATTCKEQLSGECWRDSQCGPGAICSGSFVCPCNADCAYTDYPGTCVPADAGCCRNDSGCPTGNRCVKGVCKEQLVDGTCWVDRDCPGSYCSAPNVCDCGLDCALPDVPGQCA